MQQSIFFFLQKQG